MEEMKSYVFVNNLEEYKNTDSKNIGFLQPMMILVKSILVGNHPLMILLILLFKNLKVIISLSSF
ncbi:MAG: hypothetical protein CM15mP102_09190 [Flavobacteriales bacterium]|nr:MAG: hypothetical protein CM15mP102_09190 [Flavobacteriales bacterium]